MSLFSTLAGPYSAHKGSSTGTHFIATALRARQHHGSANPLGRGREGRKSSYFFRRDGIDGLESVFIRSLSIACLCSDHKSSTRGAAHTLRRKPKDSERRHGAHHGQSPTRNIASNARNATWLTSLGNEITSEQYLGLVDTYPQFRPKRSHLRQQNQRNAVQKQHLPLAPRLVLTPEQEDLADYGRQILEPETEEHRIQLERFSSLLREKVASGSYSRIWRAYEALPEPRPRYLSDAQISRLFRHLSGVEFKNVPHAMQNYFSVLDDCEVERVPLHTGIWNAAIAFAGRWMRDVSSKRLQSAIETWMRMENANRQATSVTFQVLFDVAIRAGRFALADTLLNEVKERKLAFHRHFRTSMILYAGFRGDGDGVRQSFRDFVNAGEIVDAGTMNCVIVSLLRAGEVAGAEHVFYSMKALHETQFHKKGPPAWQQRRELGRQLDHIARSIRAEEDENKASFFGSAFSSGDKRERIQEMMPIAPNARTFRMFIQYHAAVSGDLHRIRMFTNDMEEAGFGFHPSLFVHLLRGFWTHGGRRSSLWSHTILEDLWRSFITAVDEADGGSKLTGADEGPELVTADFPPQEDKIEDNNQTETSGGLDDRDGTTNLVHDAFDDAEGSGRSGKVPEFIEADIAMEKRPAFVNKAVAFAAVRAFSRCADRSRMFAVWEQVETRWKGMTPIEKEELQALVTRLSNGQER